MDAHKSYSEDPRLPCHYGRKCYQKNPNHHIKYKHPPDPKRKNQYRNNNDDVKRRKMDLTTIDNKKINETELEHELNNIPIEAEPSDVSTQLKVFSNDVSDSDSETESTNPNPINIHSDQKSPTNSSLENGNYFRTKSKKDTTCNHINGHNTEFSKVYIKSKFLFEMPEDFYKFFELCERLNADNPSDALISIGLKLVGPFDVLNGKFCGVDKNSDDYLIHWRYYYDPPNLQTILKGDDKTGYHIGYFRDNPDDKPVFLVENYGMKDGILTPIGENIFGAISSYIEDRKKTCDPFSKMKFNKIQNIIKEEADKLSFDLSRKTKKMTKRNDKVLSRTFNKVGLVVPYERKTQLGYRKLAMSDKELGELLTKIDKAKPEEKSKFLAELQSEILTWTDIACDECDFGTGIELGWDILCHGVDLSHTTSRLLASNFRQLKWEAFAKISEAHMANRKKSCRLSII